MTRVRKNYGFNGLAGCVVQRKARTTGTLVGVYNSEQAGLEQDSSCVWMTVCEAHNTLVGHASLQLAMGHAVDPEGWCQFCRLRNNRYILVDDAPNPFSFDDLLKQNESLRECDKEDIANLDVGESLLLGGGAAAEFTIQRVS
jgi:hypothetical protein